MFKNSKYVIEYISEGSVLSNLDFVNSSKTLIIHSKEIYSISGPYTFSGGLDLLYYKLELTNTKVYILTCETVKELLQKFNIKFLKK